ncbi:hypothetical protein [Streptomyces sp. NBC_01565]|uniref:hypothetical protein n=1 Tax=Streptomyces sp. NBC_01565 TaxID=2975881 RepID=UPI0022540351|nr:hypothetical protein [Streptomyces sp. NBC_01565]MCX4540484.1 hypothetical protein [Streptomyces sp. NBC_01565]
MRTADRIAVGAAVLTRRTLGSTWQTVAIRGGGAALVSPYVLAELRGYPLAVPVGVAAWLGAAWWFGQPSGERPVKGKVEGAADRLEAAAEPDEGLLPDAVRHLAQGGHGAHLKAIAEHLTEETGQPWDTAAVRAACQAAGIPVTDSVRQPGRGVSTGVRLADLPDPSPNPSPAVDVAVVVAGQDTPTDAATGTSATATPAELQVHVEGGGALVVVRDPAETRHYTTTPQEAHRG